MPSFSEVEVGRFSAGKRQDLNSVSLQRPPAGPTQCQRMGGNRGVERYARRAGSFLGRPLGPVGRSQRRRLQQRAALVQRQRGRGWVQVKRQDLTPFPLNSIET